MTHLKGLLVTLAAGMAAVASLGACSSDTTAESCLDETIDLLNATDFSDEASVAELEKELENEDANLACDEAVEGMSQADKDAMYEELAEQVEPEALEWLAAEAEPKFEEVGEAIEGG